MPENDIRLYQVYAARNFLPHRRVDLHLAQIAQALAVYVGKSENASLADFLIKPQESEDEENEASVEDIDAAEKSAAEAFGFNPRNANRVRDNTDGQ
jgi:DNA polymerase IIIc chi subunit